jgi:hypothetical protein
VKTIPGATASSPASTSGRRARDPRILVHLDAEAVARPMTERLAEAVAGQRVARRRVDVEARAARRDGRDGAIARLAHGGVDLAGPSTGRSDRNSPGQVDAV